MAKVNQTPGFESLNYHALRKVNANPDSNYWGLRSKKGESETDLIIKLLKGLKEKNQDVDGNTLDVCEEKDGSLSVSIFSEDRKESS